MSVKNFLKMRPEYVTGCHDGVGTVKIVSMFGEGELKTPLRFLHYTVLPPLTAVGAHAHGDDEEIYILLEGEGVMLVDGEEVAVGKGDVILNKPYGTHALKNTSDSEELKILVFEVANIS